MALLKDGPSIAIIGAGVAGLSAARCFQRSLSGAKVTVFEARNRIGGRVKTDEQAAVDLGASFIHGIGSDDEPNSFMSVIEQAGGKFSDMLEVSALFDPEGKELPEKRSAEIGQRFWDLFEQAIAYSKENSDKIDHNTSLNDYLDQSLQQEDALFREQCLQYAQLWGQFVGTDIRKQSLKFFYFEQVISSDLFTSKGIHEQGRSRLDQPSSSLRPTRKSSRLWLIPYGI